ncbi:MAG: oligosaccharide flippase family protein [Saprospiraceae bacterium]|nr:oligosaccharide flippase family protein [Saprospiraceae bacterium]
MSLLKKLASETAIYGLSSIIGRVINFLLVPIHSRVFLEGEYGISQKLYSVVGIAMVFLTFRLETAYFRFGTDPTERERSFGTALTALLVGSAIWAALGFVFLQPLSSWLLLPDRTDLVGMILAILAFDVIAEIPFARLRLEKRPFRFATIKIIGILVNVALTVVFLVWWRTNPDYLIGGRSYNANFGIGYVFLANLIASGVVLLLLMFTIKSFKAPIKVQEVNQPLDAIPKAQPSFKLSFDKAIFKKMVIYSAPLVVVGLAGVADETLDRILMEKLLPGTLDQNRETIGIYSACYKLTVILALFTQAFRYAAEPFFFANSKNKDAPELYGQVAKFFTLISALGMLFVLLYLDAFQHILGKDFRGALNAVPIILVATLFLGVYYNFSTWYRLTDRTIWGVYIALLGLGITIVFNTLWIPVFGYMGAAYAKLLCYGAMTVAAWYFGQRYFPVNYPLGRMAFYVGLSLGIWFLAEKMAEALGYSFLLKMVVNSFLLVGFIGIAWKMERQNVNSI